MRQFHIARNLFAPKRRAYAALYNPAGSSSYIGAAILRKTIDPTAWIIGSNNLAIANNGAVRIESMLFRVTTAFGSAGAPTLVLRIGGRKIHDVASLALADLALGSMLVRQTAAGVTTNNNQSGIEPVTNPSDINASMGGGFLLASTSAQNMIQAFTAVATYNAGSAELVVIYTPLTAGATLS